MTDKLPESAYNVEIEQTLLGACLVNNELLSVARETVSGEAFYDPLHGRIFEAMLVACEEPGGVATPLTLSVEFKTDPAEGELPISLREYFSNLMHAAPAIAPRMAQATVQRWAKIIRELALRRDAIFAAEDALQALTRTALPVGTALRGVMAIADEAAAYANRKPPASADQLGLMVVGKAEQALAGKPVPMVKTGFARLDAKIGGLRAGDVIYVAGRAGMGKSALMGCVARNVARANHPVKIYSLEMSDEQWWERTLCDEDFDWCAGQQSIWYERIRNGQLKSVEVERIEMARQRLGGIRLEIDDRRSMTIGEITADARNFAAQFPGEIGLIEVDYAQIVAPTPSSRNTTREQEVAAISRGLKVLAGVIGWPVVAGVQIVKSVDSRKETERRPTGGDMRESGALENDADLILAPFRKAHYIRQRRPESDAGEHEWAAWNGEMASHRNRIEILCLKNKHGEPFNDIELYCDIGASAIRDEAPSPLTPDDQATLSQERMRF